MQDYYLRTLDIETGAEMWKSQLPVCAQTTPITFVLPESGTQYVIISAGGARHSPDGGDYIVAYKLPKQNLVQNISRTDGTPFGRHFLLKAAQALKIRLIGKRQPSLTPSVATAMSAMLASCAIMIGWL